MTILEPEVVRPGLKAINVWTPQDEVALTAVGGAKPIDTSGEIVVEEGGKLALTVKNGDSTSIIVRIYTSPDGVNFDTEAYLTSGTLAANKTKTFHVDAGPRFFRVEAENKDAVNATVVTTKLTQLVGID